MATATPDRVAYLIPLSIGWTRSPIVLMTMHSSPTATNMPIGTVVRIGIGGTRDVTLVKAEVAAIDAVPTTPDAVLATFAEQSGRDASARDKAWTGLAVITRDPTPTITTCSSYGPGLSRHGAR